MRILKQISVNQRLSGNRNLLLISIAISLLLLVLLISFLQFCGVEPKAIANQMDIRTSSSPEIKETESYLPFALTPVIVTPEPAKVPEQAPYTENSLLTPELITTSELTTPEKWLDFDVVDGTTRLMQGTNMIKAVPSAWGYGKPGTDSDFFATVPGTYYIYQLDNYLWFDASYSRLWVKGFIGFDPERANGFHSFLLDETGQVVDGRLGPVSHGCIRVEDFQTLYDFSSIGMQVVVHGTMPLLTNPDKSILNSFEKE